MCNLPCLVPVTHAQARSRSTSGTKRRTEIACIDGICSTGRPKKKTLDDLYTRACGQSAMVLLSRGEQRQDGAIWCHLSRYQIGLARQLSPTSAPTGNYYKWIPKPTFGLVCLHLKVKSGTEQAGGHRMEDARYSSVGNLNMSIWATYLNSSRHDRVAESLHVCFGLQSTIVM